jgi:CRP-like cAMP-binding protein
LKVTDLDTPARAGANRFLEAIPRDTYDRIASRIERLPMSVKTETMTPGELVSHVYFPLDGIHSMTAMMIDGALVEVGIVGHEGATSVQEVLADARARNRCFVQLEGDAFRMRAEDFREAFATDGAFRDITLRYQYALGMQVSQTAACNRRHQVEHRLARWLLMTHDRVTTDELRLTHEFLAIMLATPRPVVTRAVGALTAEGVITHGRGSVTVVDRKGLEALSCECYEIVAGVYAEMYDGATD